MTSLWVNWNFVYNWSRALKVQSKLTAFEIRLLIGFCISQYVIREVGRLQWAHGLGHGPAAACILGLQRRIPLGTLTSVFCECCVLSGIDPYVGLITRPEEPYRVWCVIVWEWSLELRRSWPTRACCTLIKITTALHYVTNTQLWKFVNIWASDRVMSFRGSISRRLLRTLMFAWPCIIEIII